MTADEIEARRINGATLGQCYEWALTLARTLEAELQMCVDKLPEPIRKTDAVALEIYELYPRKAARPAALKAIRSAIKKIGIEELRKHVQAYAAYHAASGIEQCYTPMPSTWFNQERWNDTPVAAPVRGSAQAERSQIELLRQAIRTSPALPGGTHYVDISRQETKDLLKRNIDELLKLSPNEDISRLSS